MKRKCYWLSANVWQADTRVFSIFLRRVELYRSRLGLVVFGHRHSARARPEHCIYLKFVSRIPELSVIDQSRIDPFVPVARPYESSPRNHPIDSHASTNFPPLPSRSHDLRSPSHRFKKILPTMLLLHLRASIEPLAFRLDADIGMFRKVLSRPGSWVRARANRWCATWRA